MALSALRLRLATAFALTFAGGLVLFAAAALGYLWRESHHRLDRRLDAVLRDVRRNLELELRETPESTLAYAASEVVHEWPRAGGAFLIVDSAAHLVSHNDEERAAARVLDRWKRAPDAHFRVGGDEPDYRAAVGSYRISIPAEGRPTRTVAVGVVAFASIEGIEADTELLTVAIVIAAPLILLASLTAGYLVARRALRPVVDLGAAIAAIVPADLSHRLAVPEPRDEVGALAAEFNLLLERLHEAQLQNRTFLREAAHQIRTPLTLVLGEAAHELASAESTALRMRESLTRIRTAAEQMRRRVDELFLLAEAQSGERVTLDDTVEMDGLVLECADLMRARAKALGRTLAIGRAEHIVTRANSGLLQEAVLELLENALRHANALLPVTISVFRQENAAVLEVVSGGEPFSVPARGKTRGPDGLGLAIVRWVAEVHDGAFGVEHGNARNVVRITIPIVTSAASPSLHS